MSEGLHHRCHERLQSYWEELLAGRALPRENDINPDALSDIWKSCFLICIDPVTKQSGYRYSYLGEDLVDAYGDDMKNPDVARMLLSTANAPIVKIFDEAVRQKRPVVDEAEFVNLKNVKIRYRKCVVPLGNDQQVTHLLGCMRWKIY